MKYQLTLTKAQAEVVATACEFFCRIKMGQFSEIIWHLLVPQEPDIDEFCERRDKAEDLLFEARKQIYPELYGRGHSYGIGKFEDADRAFRIYEVVRHALGRGDGPWEREDIPTITALEETDEPGAEELKNCPFCGGPAELYTTRHVPSGTDWTPRCKAKSCCGRLAKKFSTKEAAVAYWNRRA